MLEILEYAMKQLPALLNDVKNFDSLIVNRRKPYTYRVFTNSQQWDGHCLRNYRICLHKFDPCDTHESFLHPHPWPGAFTILKGSYKMKVGYSVSRTEKPSDVLDLILRAGSSYEITNPLTWHAITPLETTYTVMVNGEPWDAETAHVNVVTTKGKDLDKLEPNKLQEHLDIFKNLSSR